MKHNVFVLAVLLFITQVVIGQNTGPFSPDHSGFIPADNSKVVNLVSGDFFYTLPVVTIPGPQGGFPLGLSYEAGITFDQEASWVGLGWSLTPGSINRAVNGFPDDWRQKEIHYVIPDGSQTIKQDLSWAGYVSYGLQNKLGVNKLLHGFYRKTTHQGQVNSKRAYGALYVEEGAAAAVDDVSEQFTGYNVMDVYAIDDGSTDNANTNAINEKFMQFHNYDQYNVSVQGLVGSIQPRINEVGPVTFDPLLNVSNSKQDYAWDTENAYSKVADEIYFSFKHKHNSYFESNLPEFSVDNSTTIIKDRFSTGYDPTTDDISTLPSEIQDQYLQTSAYTSTKRRIEGNHIEWFTNDDLTNASSLLDCKARGYIENSIDRSNFDPTGIGAFVVTDKNGMSYHFSLPVYQYEEIFNHTDGTNKQRIIKADKYAYTWLLTAIVGPDFIDDGDNTVDEGDLGYWVKFDYGLWSDGYQWRIPYSGDISNGTTSFNYTGRKQIYYLDRITTASHSAFFIKNLRDDAKSYGSSLSETLTDVYPSSKIYEDDFTGYTAGDNTHVRRKDISITPGGETQVLSLEKILIVPNKVLNGLSYSKNSGSGLVSQKTGNVEITEDININGTHYSRNIVPDTDYSSMKSNNVYDVNDNLADLENAAIQIVNLGYDYSLEQALENADAGSLTLKSLQVDAYGGNSDIPPYEFSYYNDQATPSVYSNLFNEETSKPVDDWGLVKGHPEENALKEILYPEGKRLEIKYEPDMYYLVDDDYYEEIEGPVPPEFTYVTPTYVETKREGYKTNFSDSVYGGYRVSELIIKNQNKQFVTEYNYSYDDKGHGGGTVLYKPYENNRNKCIHGYQLLPYISPLYKRVEVIDYGMENNDGTRHYKTKSVTEFETFDKLYETRHYNFESPNDITNDYSNINYDGILKLEWKTAYSNEDNIQARLTDIIIHDNSNKLGRIKSSKVLNKFDELLSEQSYSFVEDYALTAGINKESAYNIAYTTAGDDHWNLSTYAVREYPQVSSEISSGQENSSSTSNVTKFDLITGMPVVLESGNMASEITPAYRLIPEMGSKSENPSYANMLSSVAYSKRYNSDKVLDNVYHAEAKIYEKVEEFYFDGASHTFPLASSDVNINNWRVTKVYNWDGPVNADGTYMEFNDASYDKNFDFSPATSTTNTDNGWLLARDNMEYNKYMNPMTYKYTNGILNTNIYNIHHDKTIAKVFGCSRNSATFSSFEEHNGSLINGGLTTTGSVSFKEAAGSVTAHSGSQMLELAAGANVSVTFNNSNADIPIKPALYQFDVWVNKSSGNSASLSAINGSTIVTESYNEDKDVGDWVLLSLTADFSSLEGNTITFKVSNPGSAAIYIDDFRVRPIDASMETYVFDATTGRLMSTLNPNHFATHYKYDQNGQVNEVWQESLKYGLQKMSESSYGYYRNVQQ